MFGAAARQDRGVGIAVRMLALAGWLAVLVLTLVCAVLPPGCGFQ
jgi:hypothetical protein